MNTKASTMAPIRTTAATREFIFVLLFREEVPAWPHGASPAPIGAENR